MLNRSKRDFKLGDVGLGRADLRVVGRSHELGDDGRGENAENDDHDHDFDQRESRRFFLKQRFHFISCPFVVFDWLSGWLGSS